MARFGTNSFEKRVFFYTTTLPGYFCGTRVATLSLKAIFLDTSLSLFLMLSVIFIGRRNLLGKYILSRVFQTLPVIFGVLIISFFLMIVLPGDPVLSIVGERYDEKTVEIKIDIGSAILITHGVEYT